MARKFDIRPRCEMRSRCDTKDMMREMQSRCDVRDVIPEMQLVKCKMRDADQMQLLSEIVQLCCLVSSVACLVHTM